MNLSALTVRVALVTVALVLSVPDGTAVAAVDEPTEAVPTNGVKKNFDPVYNVCRGTDPRCYNPWASNRQNKVLLYTRTGGPRHANLGTALAAGLNPPLNANNTVQHAIIAWMAEQGVAVDWTEDVTRLSNLNQYKAVIFASTSRDALWEHGTAVAPGTAVNTTTSAHLDAAKTALRQYMRAGGGFVGIHNAFGTEYNWPYYEGLLGNANYYDHAANQDGVSVVVNADSSTEGLPLRWDFRDEWYNLEPFPTNVKFLTTVDEKTLATRGGTHPGHGDFHPTSWCQYYDGGRSWVTTLGHDRGAFTEGSGFPGQREYKLLIVNGILSAMGNKPFCRQ
jgi:type 1 glutamine amidotransferase